MELKKKLIINLLSFGIAGSIAIGLILYFLLPTYFCGTGWYIVLSVFFLIAISLVVNYVISVSEKVTDRRLANVYLLILMVQMLFVLVVITLYSLLIKENTPGFALTFVLLFLLFLGLETWSFVQIEKYLKEKK